MLAAVHAYLNSARRSPCILAFLLGVGSVVFPAESQGQAFKRITTGPVATDTGRSLGVAWGDYNNDGHLDLFVANTGVGNWLYTNNGDGTFTKVTSGPVVGDTGDSRGSLWADYDNDGDLDLYVSNRGGNVPPPVTAPVQANFLYRNDGPPNYTFTAVTDQPVTTTANYTWSSSWVDYDNDGDLDLHMPDNLHAADDFFFENDGRGQFSSVVPAFVEPGSQPSTGVASWVDFDDDGDQDVLLAKSGRFLSGGAENNRLFRNQLAETGTLGFEEITTGGIVTHFDNDFQASWGDYDNDGDLDVFLGHAGGPQGNNNYLYRNDGDGTFIAIVGTPLTAATFTLGSAWGDYDNDGDLDLLVASAGTDELFRNEGGGTFTKLTGTEAGDIVTTSGNGWGAAWGDYDNDGLLDAIVVNDGTSSQNYLYRNTQANGNHWLHLDAQGTVSSRSGIGARIYATATIEGQRVRQVRHITGSPTGDRSQNPLRVHFGLGDAEQIDTLRILWPAGTIDVLTNVAVDQILTVEEGSSPIGRIEAPAVPAGLQLHEAYPNPFREAMTLHYALPQAASVRLAVFDLLGRRVYVQDEGVQPAGTHQFRVSAAALPNGTYFYRLEAGPHWAGRWVQVLR